MRSMIIAVSAILVAMATGCASEPTDENAQALNNNVKSTLSTMRAQDPNFGSFVDQAYAYAVFPSVGKGALIIGGAYGRGEVYEQGRLIGYATMTEGTVGAQVGGQDFAEVICFRNKNALNDFTQGKYAVAADASAIALKEGASTAVDYNQDVAIFTYAKGGLMAEAAVGGQKFTFSPVESNR